MRGTGDLAELQEYLTALKTATAPWAVGSYSRETLIRWERDGDVTVAMSVAEDWARYERDSAAFSRGSGTT